MDLLRGLACTGLLLMTLLMTGCGADHGPQPVDVSGTVTFDGRSVPLGMIYFDPDIDAGTDGVQGFAKIHDGAYDTRQTGKGITGGAYRVRIRGVDALGDESGRPPQPLFNEYHIAVEFPLEATTRDFKVPASAAKDLSGIPKRVP